MRSGAAERDARFKRTVEVEPEHFQFWREAFSLLLTDTMTLEEIALTRLYNRLDAAGQQSLLRVWSSR